ncbi:SDR family oxidoreductase [Rhodococcus sp. (in: high G+C Gram-positive bacteria)]|uniref:SDR family NAD(P)-dependent oxidoreductase n=1 Tax=Rhodococcus sp. TaxID=1831 RepID=UPI00257D6CC0|nr:SDR family oxidoreductase [Rhodococcus sp. (in: high G+C Gram-positive bacteria)]MBQ9052611.1 SDR family oxidoreductase [Rhodococcus sp. (in: high G+C Gram-positive bacteria)]
MTKYRLQDKSVVITGGASGIGRASALLAAQSGAKITVADIDADGGKNVVEEIISAGGTAQFIETDISQEDSVENLIASAIKEYGRVDAAFNNAAIAGRGGLLHEWSSEEYNRLIAITLTGNFYCLKHEVRHMIEAGGGSIVMTSAGGAFRMVPQIGAYAMAKGGVNNLVRQAAYDYGSYGIRVNAVVPGVVRTPMLGAQPTDTDDLAAMQPLGRMGEPEEIAEAALWLLSDNSSFATGAFLDVDGGLTL